MGADKPAINMTYGGKLNMNDIKRFIDRYFVSTDLPNETRILNFVCLFSAVAGVSALLSRLIAGVPFSSYVSLILMDLCIIVVFFVAIKSKAHATFLMTATVFSVICVFWPFHFFTIGGPASGMAAYFAMIIICDFVLLKGKSRVFALVLTCAVIIFCYAVTLFFGWPTLPAGGLTDFQLFVDMLQSIFIVGFLMGIIILHQMKMYQHEKEVAETAREEIRDNEELLKLLNEASVTLLAVEPDHFEEVLSKSMEKIAARLQFDCIYIWRATERDNEAVYEKIYSLLSSYDEDEASGSNQGANYLKRVPEWESMLTGGDGYVSSSVSKFTGEIHDVLSAYHIKAINAFPVFYHGEYWGFVSFDNRRDERLCLPREASILRSASMLLANAVERNESILRLNSARLTMSSMFEANPHMNVLFDSKFNIVDFNPAAMEFMDYETKEQMRAEFMTSLIKGIPEYHSNGRPTVPLSQRFATTIKEGVETFETELHLNNKKRNLNVVFKKIPYEESFAIVAYVFDITDLYMREMDLKKAREINESQLAELNTALHSLEAAQQTVTTMFGANPHINILFDSQFNIVDCNPASVEYMGFATKEDMIANFAQALAGSIPEKLSNGRPTRPIAEWFGEAVRNGYVKLETEFILQGTTRNVNIELKKIPYGADFAIVGYILDITEMHEREMELKRRDQQLSEAVEEARAANEAKSAFLSTMSHEIRTPMNAILGITEILLQDEELDTAAREALGKIYTSGDMLLGIINDILDLSKIEAGKLEIAMDKYEIASLVSDTAQLNMMRIGSKPIEFELYIDKDTPMVLKGDELRVKQVLNNVLSNAFKYTTAGTVTLSIDTEPIAGADDKVTLILRVKDTGQGMTKKQVAQLFDEYSRFNAEANRETEGTGLGMSITRNLIRLMDGDILVESEPGVGSEFTLRIPQTVGGPEVLGAEMAENLHNFRTSSRTQMKRVQISREPMPYGSVLIVDDVETNIYVAKGLLAPYELKIESADSGFVAIDKIKLGKVYDIIFMDHMMPKMDGIEATRIIRDFGYTQPIVALTANAVAGQADIFLGNGFDDFISKPIDIRQLNSVLNKLIRDKQPPHVIEEAKKAYESRRQQDSNPALTIDPQFAEIFLRDAAKTISVFKEIDKKGSYDFEDDLRMYTIHAHGIKSALANIGNMELSAVAFRLEMAARDKQVETVKTETRDFTKKLQAFVEELTASGGGDSAGASIGEIPRLHELMRVIKTACEEYDEGTANKALKELRASKWPQPVTDMLSGFAEYLLHSDFELVVEDIDRYFAAVM